MPITMRITHLMIISNTIVITYTSSSGSSKTATFNLRLFFLGLCGGLSLPFILRLTT